MDADTKRILREELWRSVVWAGLGLVGWAVLVTESPRLDANVLTVVGLPIFTWAALTVSMIAVRLSTGQELKVRSEGGLWLSVILGVILAGFAAAFLIVVQDRPATLVGSIYVIASIGTILWTRYVVLPSDEWAETT